MYLCHASCARRLYTDMHSYNVQLPSITCMYVLAIRLLMDYAHLASYNIILCLCMHKYSNTNMCVGIHHVIISYYIASYSYS